MTFEKDNLKMVRTTLDPVTSTGPRFIVHNLNCMYPSVTLYVHDNSVYGPQIFPDYYLSVVVLDENTLRVDLLNSTVVDLVLIG